MFVRLAVYPQLLQDGGGSRDVGGQQVDAGDVTVGGATGRLAIDGDGIPAVMLDPPQDPAREGFLQSRHIEAAKELAEAALVGGTATGEAEGVRQRQAVVAAELGDGLQALHAGQGSDDGQG